MGQVKTRCMLMCALACVLVLSSAGVSAKCERGEMVIKFSHVVNTTRHPKGITVELLAKRINKDMQGIACMQVYPNAILYNDDKVLEALLNNDVQFAAPSLSKFENFTKKFRIFDLPFLFRDIQAVDRFQQSQHGQALKDSMQRRGIQGLVFWHNGMKQLSANRPLLKPSDARGLKFRVQPSEVLVAQFQALGASPQKMAYSEVYAGLQTKVVDGQENTWSNIYGSKLFEVQDGVTETHHGVLDYLLVTSKSWWQGLPKDIRTKLLNIVHEVTDLRNHKAQEINQRHRDSIIAAGGVIRTLTPEQRSAWVEALRPVWKQFEKDIGAEALEHAISISH